VQGCGDRKTAIITYPAVIFSVIIHKVLAADTLVTATDARLARLTTLEVNNVYCKGVF